MHGEAGEVELRTCPARGGRVVNFSRDSQINIKKVINIKCISNRPAVQIST